MLDRSERHEQWAVFWCSLLSPLLWGEVPPQEAGRFLRQLADSEQLFPDGTRRRPSRATLWRKWKQYRQGGLDALVRRRRNDRGQPRRASTAMLDKAVLLKKEQPYRSDETINQFLEAEFQQQLPKSTLYRHLKRAGATRLKLGLSKQKVRGRWTRDQSNALWVGDFEDGPRVLEGGQAVETHLSAFIDCHSRFIVEAHYYLRESFDVLIDSLLRAWSLRGASRELYLDNAKIYHAQALERACLALNIRLIHRGVGDPPPGGLIERFFKTTQTQLESEVRAGSLLTLDRLNQALAAWLEVSYHERPHSETGQSPRLRYELGRPLIRYVNVQEVLKYFLEREPRTVHSEFCDVRLNGLYFRVDERLRGDKLEVRYDPYGTLESVLLYSLEGEYLGVGTRHNREPQAAARPTHPSPAVPEHDYLNLLIQKHEQAIRRRSSGIDYQAVLAQADRRWPFVEFAKHLARHMGRPAGVSAFQADELESLQKVYDRLTFLNPLLLEQACARASQPTLVEIVFVLEQLHQERKG